MNAREWVDAYADDHELDLLCADGFDDAIVGIARVFNRDIVVYDEPTVLDLLMAQGMSPSEAQEFYDVNVVGAYVGEATPAFLQRVPREECL